MARKVQGPVPNRRHVYVPKALGNRLAPTEDQVQVHLRMPSEADRRRAMARAMGVKDFEGQKPLPGMFITAGQELARLCVFRVENYEGAAGPIVDGDDFADHGETELVTEVGDVLIGGIALTKSWCKSCGESLADDAKVCPECAKAGAKPKDQEIVEGEGQPSADSSASNGSETLSAGASATEGQSTAPAAVGAQGGATSPTEGLLS